MTWFETRKILVPIDFGEESHLAIDTALQLADSPAYVFVVHVAPDLTVASPEIVWETLSDEVRQKNLEASFLKRFAAEKYRDVHFQVLFGDPGHGIAEYAEKLGAGLIVMPSHGRTGLKRLLIGSVAERVVRLAHCPVLVMRQ